MDRCTLRSTEMPNDEPYLLPTGRPFKFWGAIPLKEAFSRRLPINLLDERGLGPLEWCISKDEVNLFRQSLVCGADVNFVSSFGMTALHSAATSRQLLYLEELLIAGANPNLQDEQGNSPIHYAVEFRTLKFVQLLVDYGGNTTLLNLDKLCPLDIALRESKIDLVDYLVCYPNVTSHQDAALLLGVRKERVKVIEWALKVGANPCMEVRGGSRVLGTILDFARRTKNSQVIEIMERAINERK